MASSREYEEMHKPPLPGEGDGAESVDELYNRASGEPIHVSGTVTRLGNEERKFSVISFTSPGKDKIQQ